MHSSPIYRRELASKRWTSVQAHVRFKLRVRLGGHDSIG